MDKLISTGQNIKLATLLAMVAGLNAGMTEAFPLRLRTVKRVRRYPMPVISSPEVIAAWNAKVDERNAERRARRQREWMASA